MSHVMSPGPLLVAVAVLSWLVAFQAQPCGTEHIVGKSTLSEAQEGSRTLKSTRPAAIIESIMQNRERYIVYVSGHMTFNILLHDRHSVVS